MGTTISIDLPAEIAERLTDRANKDGQDVADYVRHLAVSDVSEDMPVRPYDPIGLVAALNSFDEDDEEEQRQTLAFLRVALDRDRPGQRRVFVEGVNPVSLVNDVI